MKILCLLHLQGFNLLFEIRENARELIKEGIYFLLIFCLMLLSFLTVSVNSYIIDFQLSIRVILMTAKSKMAYIQFKLYYEEIQILRLNSLLNYKEICLLKSHVNWRQLQYYILMCFFSLCFVICLLLICYILNVYVCYSVMYKGGYIRFVLMVNTRSARVKHNTS